MHSHTECVAPAGALSELAMRLRDAPDAQRARQTCLDVAAELAVIAARLGVLALTDPETDDLLIESLRGGLGLGNRASARVLVRLLRSPDQIVLFDELLHSIAARRGVAGRPLLRVYLVHLRRALVAHGLHDIVQCVKGRGYYIRSEDARRVLIAWRQQDPGVASMLAQHPKWADLVSGQR